jgi:hypothetical protein
MSKKKTTFKFKIESTIDIDIYKFFNEIPDGTFAPSEFKDEDAEYYAVESVSKVINSVYTSKLMEHMEGMTKSDYTHSAHHLKISQEIAKQIVDNIKIEKL